MNSDVTKVYPSKIGIGLLVFLALIFGSILAIATINQIWIMFLALMPAILFIVNIYLSTYYQVTSDKKLLIKSGILFNVTIEIDKIKKIKYSNSFLSAPALSLERLELFYNTYDSVIISPKNKNEFIAHLLNNNPDISIQE